MCLMSQGLAVGSLEEDNSQGLGQHSLVVLPRGLVGHQEEKGGPVDAGNPNIPGGSISCTTTGSLPWSKGHSSPRIQNPFSVEMKAKKKPLLRIHYSGATIYV